MSDRETPPLAGPARPTDTTVPRSSPLSRTPAAEAMLCDRCSAGMFRMHAVWRCPVCGFKTDCCGW